MKKMIIGLAVLSSVSAFANCEEGTAECHLGTYTGQMVNPSTGRVQDDKCQITISKNKFGKNKIKFEYLEINSNGDVRELSGKVSSEKQWVEDHEALAGSYRYKNPAETVEYTSTIRLQNDLPKSSKRKKYNVGLTLDDNLELVGIYVNKQKHHGVEQFFSLGLAGGWHSQSGECTNLVKID